MNILLFVKLALLFVFLWVSACSAQLCPASLPYLIYDGANYLCRSGKANNYLHVSQVFLIYFLIFYFLFDFSHSFIH
jgi:hypothetical protein